MSGDIPRFCIETCNVRKAVFRNEGADANTAYDIRL